MMKFLAPGIALMRHLRFAEKFILISLLLMLPLGLTSYYLFHNLHQRVALMEQRRIGLQYLAAINPLLELIPQHRGMTNGLLQGHAAFAAKLTAMQPMLQHALAQADAANRQWGGVLVVEKDWQRIRSHWINLLRVSDTLSVHASWQQHTNLIADYLQLVYRVLVTSTLYTTEDAGLRHLVEITFHYLPQLIEGLGQLRGTGAGFLADHRITIEEQRQWLLLIDPVIQNSTEVNRQWLFAFEYSPELRAEFMHSFDKLRQMIVRYRQLTHQQGILSNRPDITASDYFNAGTRVIKAGYTLLHHSNIKLQSRFNIDSKRLNQRMQWLQILLIIMPLIIAYLISTFFVFTRQTVQQFHYVMAQLQQRKIPVLKQETGRDELADIGRLFNRLSGQMIRKNEEDQLLGELTKWGLLSESLTVLCDQALVLLMDAHSGISVKAPSQIQLLRDSGNRYVAAGSEHTDILVEVSSPSPLIHQLNDAEHNMWCLPLIHRKQRLGELLLTLEGEDTLTNNRLLLQRIADALVISIVRLQAMHALEEREQALMKSNEELERFAYVASHDLQEPLRKICSFGDRLQQRAELTGRHLDFLMRMVDAAERMQLLIQDLLIFSRVQSSTRPFAPVDLNKVAAYAMDNLEIAIKECGGKVDILPLPGIDGDAVQLEQLLQNLIGNAIKYRQADVAPQIQLKIIRKEAQDDGEMLLHLQCQDNGIGFEQQYAEQIFEAFKRLHGRKEYSGSGIGLAVCRRIVERHGGTIRATSTPGEGTCIHFTLQMNHRKE